MLLSLDYPIPVKSKPCDTHSIHLQTFDESIKNM